MSKRTFHSRKELDDFLTAELQKELVELFTYDTCNYHGSTLTLDECHVKLLERKAFTFTKYQGSIKYEFKFYDNHIAYRENDFTNKEILYVFQEIDPTKSLLLQVEGAIDHYEGGFLEHEAEIFTFANQKSRADYMSEYVHIVSHSLIDPNGWE